MIFARLVPLALALTLGMEGVHAERHLLFLRGNLEISFGQPCDLDATLIAHLEDAGFRTHIARDFNPLTLEFLRQFHGVVWIGISPAYAEGRLYSPANWQGGLHLLTVRENAALLRQYVEEGGGLLLNPSVDEMGLQIIPSHQRILADYGITTLPGQIRDPVCQFEFFKVLKRFPLHMAWTEQITEHPVTRFVRRIYYPAYTMRWDDNFTTLPLYPQDPAWTTLVKAEPTARVSNYRGTPFEQGHWKEDSNAPPQPALAAVRPFGRGRVGAISIGHYHLFYFPYSDKPNFREITFGPQNGILMTKGDGQTPSDLERLLLQMLNWLGEPALAAGFGFRSDSPIPLKDIPEVSHPNLAEVWAHQDPLVTGPVRPMRILVGARTALSDGRGTVAEYRNAALDAGYDVIAFTETYEQIPSDAAFRSFVEECKRLSDDKVFFLPGLDVEDALGNRFLLVGVETPVREHLRVEHENETPGKRLIWTGHMLLGMGETLPIPSRPQHLNTVRKHGALPPELYSHFAGIAVETYRKGLLVDEGLSAFQWHLFNASVPTPVAVHEVYGPDELPLAATSGLQTIVNSDTPARAATYFRQGHLAFGGNPMRTYLSSGPIAESYTIEDWQTDPWSIRLRLRSNVPITEVRVFDQHGLYRHFRPGRPDAELTWHGNLGAQQWFFVEALDANGGRALFSPVRTLPGTRAFIRCMDRQNWFSGLHFSIGVSYTGRIRSLPHPITFSLPGVTLPAPPAPKLHLPYNGEGHTIVDYVLDGTLVPGARDPGADAAPIFNHLPVEPFTGRMRLFYYMPTRSGSSRPLLTVVENRITLRQPLEAIGPVWPILHSVPSPRFRYWDRQKAQWTEGTLDQEETLDLPAGTLVASNLILLDSVRLDGKGRLGGNPAPGPFPPGSEWRLRFLPVSPAIANTALAVLGFGESLPYQIALTHGALEIAGLLSFRAGDQGGTAGRIIPASDPLPFPPGGDMIAELQGGNPQWPLGVWTSDHDLILPYQYLENIGRGRLPIHRATEFYFGSLLIATHPKLALQFTKPWTPQTIAIEVHNPTAEPITATVQTTPFVPSRRALKQTVTVPPGMTLQLEETAETENRPSSASPPDSKTAEG